MIEVENGVTKLSYDPEKNGKKITQNLKDFYKDLCDYMSSGECLCCSCHKDCEDPIEDMKKLKDKVRENWGKDEMKNGMHSSDSLENVNRESKICLSSKSALPVIRVRLTS